MVTRLTFAVAVLVELLYHRPQLLVRHVLSQLPAVNT